MHKMRWAAIASGVVLMIACFFPWVTIESKDIVVSGVRATGTLFGKPGYMHLLMAVLTILLLVTRKVLALRISIFLTAFNAAWSIRNLIVISACYGGICPQKQVALYIVVLSSVAMLGFNLFTGYESPDLPTTESEL
jgi:hypothetical protein